jgi:outer membrane lipoprotein SlyB
VKKPIVVLMACAFLAACGSTGGTDPSKLVAGATTDASAANRTPEQQKLREQTDSSTRTIVEGVAVGAAAGLAGAAIADLAGADVDAGTYAIAAAGGAALGGLAGAYVDQKQKEYASLEDQLDSVIADAKTKNAQAKDLTATMQKVLDQHKRELTRLRSGVKKGTATQAELDAELASARADKDVMDKAVAGTRENLKIFTDARTTLKAKATTAQDQSRIGQLDREIRTLSGRVDTMSGVVNNLTRRI